MTNIRAIFGHETGRDGEVPTAYILGDRPHGSGSTSKVTRIEQERENHGTHESMWFAVYDGELLIAKMNASAVAEILYVTP
jgi:hypothetical protein